MKIYTRTGDQGTTGLFGGGRVAKAHPRIDAYGTVDEANAAVGLARARTARDLPEGDAARLEETLHGLQHDLFVLGADLATPLDARASVHRVDADDVRRVEETIDGYEEDLPALAHFVLPGGSETAAALHLARTVTRRAERLTVAASATDTFNEHVLVYLNRLSDLLFVLARWANVRSGERELVWKGRQ